MNPLFKLRTLIKNPRDLYPSNLPAIFYFLNSANFHFSINENIYIDMYSRFAILRVAKVNNWKVVYYNEKVKAKIRAWPQKLVERFLRVVDLVEIEGANLRMPLARAFGNGLFEIRIKSKDGIGRAFFCYATKQEIMILHGFIKKTREIPLKELKLAQARMKEVKNAI